MFENDSSEEEAMEIESGKHLMVALSFDKDTEDKAEALSYFYRYFGQDREFFLGKDFIPHGSIYHGIFPKDAIQTIGKILEVAAQTTKVIEGNFKLRRPGDWLFLVSEPNMDVLKLHNGLVPILNQLRSGSILANRERITPEQRYYQEVYGYPYVLYNGGGEFHLTVQKLHSRLSQSLVLRPFSCHWRATWLVLGEIGKFGSLTKIIKSFRLDSEKVITFPVKGKMNKEFSHGRR